MAYPPDIRDDLPLLAIKFANCRNPQHEMAASDRKYLNSIYVTDKKDGTLRLPNLQLIMQWQGWGTQACGLVTTANPCISRNTCGKISEGWCQTCGEVIAQFGASWHHRTMTAVLIEVLREHAVAHRFSQHSLHWRWNTEPHKCDRHCALHHKAARH